MGFKNILVATDFSDEAYGALYYATQLLATIPCTFCLINSYDDPTVVADKQNVLFIGKRELLHLRTTSEENLTKTTHKIILDTGNELHTFNTVSRKGALSKVISQAIDELKIDLVVLGNKGKTGAKEVFMGSNTFAVANTIVACPLLAIPKQAAYSTLSEIAFVTDFKKGCTGKTLAPLITLASISKAAIHVLHIHEEAIMSSNQVSNKKLLKINLTAVPHSWHDELDYADKANVIQNYISKRNISMLAMAYHRRNFFGRLLHEPIVKDISIYAKTPFLILPIQD